jgi:sortase A
MRLLVREKSLGRLLKWSQRMLYACAVLLFGYCGFAFADAWLFQRHESRDLDRRLRDRGAASVGRPQPQPSPSSMVVPVTATKGLIGRLEIPRLLSSAVVVEGIDRASLRRAVGHIPGTKLPGEVGNVGLAGHRDTFFRGLKDLKIGDEIRFSTLKGSFTYDVVSLRVVEPDNVGVLASSGESVLTLVTCYPFYYVGPAPKRWILKARQVSPQTLMPPPVK